MDSHTHNNPTPTTHRHPSLLLPGRAGQEGTRQGSSVGDNEQPVHTSPRQVKSGLDTGRRKPGDICKQISRCLRIGELYRLDELVADHLLVTPVNKDEDTYLKTTSTDKLPDVMKGGKTGNPSWPTSASCPSVGGLMEM